MALAAPLLSRVRVLAAKVEGTPGTAIALADADSAFNVFDARIQQGAEMVPRPQQASFAQLPSRPGARVGTVTFSTELTALTETPLWATTFLPAVGLGQTGNVFALSLIPPGGAGAKQKTLTIGIYEDGLCKKIYGAMGNAVFRFPSARRCMVDWTFTGVWAPPVDAGILTHSPPAAPPLRFVSSALLLGAWTPRVELLTLDLGNEIYVREDSTTTSGMSHAIIGNRRVGGTINPETRLVGTKDIYGEWMAATEATLSFVCGSGDDAIHFTATQFQILNPQEGDRGGMQVDEIEYGLNNDDLSLSITTTTTAGAATTTAGATTTA